MLSSQALLEQLAPCAHAPAWWLGLSGGLDSLLLLDLLAELATTHQIPPLRVIHIHHGLHPDADAWAEHCREACEQRGLPLHCERVTLAPGGSVEEAARHARYAAFERQLGSGEVLLLAHHRDDQLETLLFRVLRGTGVRGLAGMPRERALGQGRLYRPLLGFSRSELEREARQRGLSWIDDPANTDPRFARTALRHQWLPNLRQAWPQLDDNLLRLAAHAEEANSLLDERAAEDLERCTDALADVWLSAWPSLLVERLLELSPARQRNLLRFWLHGLGHVAPEQRQLLQWQQQLTAAADRQPLLSLADYRLCRSSDRLWCLPAAGLPAGEAEELHKLADTRLRAGNGWLCWRRRQGGLLPGAGPWQIDYRQGGERVRLPGRPSQSLKQLFQEAGIPMWLRPSIPLLYCQGHLVSVAGRWNAEAFMAAPDQDGWELSWFPCAERPATD